MKHVLFLCTGNYYRSRFAEFLFNHHARRRGLPWVARSAGLRVQAPGVVNHGHLSAHTQAACAARNLPTPDPSRFPRQVTAAELAAADLVIAVKEAEHRPLLAELHPAHLPKVEFWHVDDLDCATPDQALAALEALIHQLVERLPERSLQERL